MEELYNLYKDLSSGDTVGTDQISIVDIPGFNYHKLGVDKDKYLNILVKSSDSGEFSVPAILEFIEVIYDKLCNVESKGEVFEESYSIIKLKSDDSTLQKYFLNISYLYLKEIGEKPILLDLQKKFNQLIDLFRVEKKADKNLVQGLFAELCIISISSNIDYLIKSWHISPSDKYDFNDGNEKLEVKSSSNLERIHSFSLNQTNNFGRSVIIGSVITIQTDMGLTVFDLVKKIEGKLNDNSLINKLSEIIVKTLGGNFSKASNYLFDYQYAIDSIRFYNSLTIPSISSDELDSRISGVRYDCKMEGSEEMNLDNNSRLQSALL
jgi:hypothetical protein